MLSLLRTLPLFVNPEEPSEADSSFSEACDGLRSSEKLLRSPVPERLRSLDWTRKKLARRWLLSLLMLRSWELAGDSGSPLMALDSRCGSEIFLLLRKLSRVLRGCTTEIGRITEASSVLTPFMTDEMPGVGVGVLPPLDGDDFLHVGVTLWTLRCGCGGEKMAISGANVLSKSRVVSHAPQSHQ